MLLAGNWEGALCWMRSFVVPAAVATVRISHALLDDI